jgi:aspartate kinase
MKVLKFGGGCLKDAESIKNLLSVVERYGNSIVIVVSAFGKLTNILQDIYSSDTKNFSSVVEFYIKIMSDIGFNDTMIDNIIIKYLNPYCESADSEASILAIGEIVSSNILSTYLKKLEFNHHFLDASKVIKTKESGVNAEVNWHLTQSSTISHCNKLLDTANLPILTQGFIAGYSDNNSNEITCLGREGSDYSASIFGSVLAAEQIILFKDVNGLYNKDPKHNHQAKLFTHLSYDQAYTICNHPHTVVHPKTIKQLKKSEIPLLIKNFNNLDLPGTIIS